MRRRAGASGNVARRCARRVGALVVGSLLVVLTVNPVAVGAATPVTATKTSPRLMLLEQPAWASLGTDFPIRLALTGPLAGLEVRAIVHASMTSRTGFERTVTGDRLGSTVASTEAAADTLPPSASGGRVLTLHLQDPNLARDQTRLRIPMPRGSKTGVFPVEVELRNPDTGDRISSFVTHLVAVAPATNGAPMGEPLNVSWIWRIASDPSTQTDGKIRQAFLQDVGPQGRLTRLATAASHADDVPVTLAPGPETLEAWAQRAKTDPDTQSGIKALQSAARTHQMLAEPYVPINMPSLERAGFGDEASFQLAQGNVVLNQVLGTRLDPRTTDVTPLDSAALARLELSRVDRLVVPPTSLVAPAQAPQFTPAQPFKLGVGTPFTAFQADEGLARLLTGNAPPALRAAHFLAGLAIVAIEQPNQTRGLAIEMPPRWDPEPALLTAVLKGLDGNPLLAPVSLDGLFDHVPVEQRRSQPLVRELVPVPPTPPPVTLARYRATRDRVRAFASTVGVSDPAVTAGNRGLLVSLSSTPAGLVGRRQASARLKAIDGGIATFTSGIKAPAGRTVTLTSRRADIPLSFENDTGRTVKVRVRVESDKLRFPKGKEQLITLRQRNTTKSWSVETRASGTFPLKITVTSADGRLAFGSARYTVRSTVVSGVGIFLTIGAGLFLAIWWITHWRRSRRMPIRSATLAT